MRPYYDADGVTIYHGDARDILPTLTADVIITDPPYGVGIAYDEHSDTAEELDRLVCDLFPLMTAAAPVVALTPGIANIGRWPTPTWVVAWVPLNATPTTGRWGFNGWQPVLVYGTDPYLKRGRGRRLDVVNSAASGRDLRLTTTLAHPCPKPTDFMRRLITRCSPDESDVVLDPMMGSGTTLLAARQLGRRAIGVDVSERYCELAASRLVQCVLFAPEPVEPVAALF